jgi:hypothetical protein
MGAKKYAELTAWEVQKATGSRWSLLLPELRDDLWSAE